MSTKRILSLDLLRGYFLFFIIVDHLGRFPGLFDLLTGRGWLWVSASEGFFFISGLMVGFVRGRQIPKLGFAAVWRKVWRRALELYAWSAALILMATGAMVLTGRLPGTKAGLPGQIELVKLIGETLRLHYVYGWADFLPHYVIFMLAAPLGLFIINRWRRGFLAVLGLSLAVWLSRGRHFELAWQLLFFSGLVVGYWLPELEAWATQLKTSWRRRLYRMVTLSAGVTLAVNVALMYGLPVVREHSLAAFGWLHWWLTQATNFDTWLGPFFDKYSLAPGRLIIFGLWFGALYLICRRHETALKRYFGGILLPLGQNSLYVYGWHSLVLLAVNLLFPYTLGLAANVLINLAVLAVIWLLVKLKLTLAASLRPWPSISSAKSQSLVVTFKYENLSSRR